MSREYAVPLSLNPYASQQLKRVLFALYSVALFPVFLSHLDILVKALLCAGLMVSYRHEINKTRFAFTLLWQKENQWIVQAANSEPQMASLSPMSFYISWLVVLVLKLESGANKVVVLPYDALEAQSFRQLKIRLTLLKLKDLRADGAD